VFKPLTLMTFANNRPATRRVAERETLLLAAAIYAGWIFATYFYRWAPTPILFVVGGWFLAWHGSLQHETIHGHPTRSRVINTLIGGAPLSLWLPYERYRETHLAHHASEDLTEPSADPESRYLQIRAGLRGRLEVWLLKGTSTLLGRLTLGPIVEISTFLMREAAALARGNRRRWRIWAVHLLQTTPIVLWLTLVCHMSLLRYVATFIFPGAALSLLRSFAEHRDADKPGHRIAIVENAPALGLLFLNNNLHAVHHAYPGASWMQLPALYRRHRCRILHENGGLVYDGYGQIMSRFLLSPHDDLIHRSALTALAMKP
jgi:fatty acid desaturase